MPTTKYLDYEIALLLAKYGRVAVSRALAQKVNMTPEELEATLQALPARNNVNAPRPRERKHLSSVIEELTKTRPEKAHALHDLAARFENRRFLPELRHIKRFFEQHGRPLPALKSRVESAGKLFSLLAELDPSELNALVREEPAESYSSLGVISDQILGRGN